MLFQLSIATFSTFVMVGLEDIIYFLQNRYSVSRISPKDDDGTVTVTPISLRGQVNVFFSYFHMWVCIFVCSGMTPTMEYTWVPDRWLPVQFLGFIVGLDTWYFWSHYTIHRIRFLYRNIHIKHHEHARVSVFDSGYSNLLDNLVAFAPPTILLFRVTLALMDDGAPVNVANLVIIIWHVQAIFSLSHSEYNFCRPLLFFFPLLLPYSYLPMITSNVHHLNHHLNQSSNYGAFFKGWDMFMHTIENPRKRFQRFTVNHPA